MNQGLCDSTIVKAQKFCESVGGAEDPRPLVRPMVAEPSPSLQGIPVQVTPSPTEVGPLGSPASPCHSPLPLQKWVPWAYPVIHPFAEQLFRLEAFQEFPNTNLTLAHFPPLGGLVSSGQTPQPWLLVLSLSARVTQLSPQLSNHPAPCGLLSESAILLSNHSVHQLFWRNWGTHVVGPIQQGYHPSPYNTDMQRNDTKFINLILFILKR